MHSRERLTRLISLFERKMLALTISTVLFHKVLNTKESETSFHCPSPCSHYDKTAVLGQDVH